MSNLRPTQSAAQVRDAIARAQLLERMSPRQACAAEPLRATSLGYGLGAHCGVIVMALAAGTGGLTTAGYINERSERGYKIQGVEYSAVRGARREVAVHVRTPIETLTVIRDVLSPSITDLALMFNVSRQAIYNWQAGQAVATQNEERLESLGRAADLLRSAGVAAGARPLKRKLPGGKSLLEYIQTGGSAEDAARALIATLRQEAAQRAEISARLTEHTRKFGSEQLGAPYLDESA